MILLSYVIFFIHLRIPKLLPMERNKYDVFISYSSKNQKVVEAMCAYLEQHKVRCFVAYRDIPKGVVWAKAIVEALDESKMMVVVFSEEFNLSDQVDREIELASEDKKPILTFRISNTMFKGAKKYYLKNINWIDAFPNPENLFDSLLDNVAKLIGFSLSEIERQERGYKPIQDNNKQYPKIINGHEYVDLGLPSGKKWATCNVGANKPEDHGDYYAWGEVRTKIEYTKNNSVTYGKKYNDIKGNPQYDVVRKNWGGTWRLPTKMELKELINECTWKWTKQHNVNGYNVTGPNGNSIFLPAPGYRSGTSLYYDGYYGFYWSSTPHDGIDDYAYRLNFNSGNEYVDYSSRCNGHTVRPISE